MRIKDDGSRGGLPRIYLLLLHLPLLARAQMNEYQRLIENIARSSLLNTRPGSTVERDVQALISFFNNTCTEAQSDATDVANPYRGAFAQVSQWRQQKGWRTIVEAHSNVRVQCRALYMQGAEEFAAKHCFWNVQSLNSSVVYPSPRWSIVEDCCENLDRPILRVKDAVWATTLGTSLLPSFPLPQFPLSLSRPHTTLSPPSRPRRRPRPPHTRRPAGRPDARRRRL